MFTLNCDLCGSRYVTDNAQRRYCTDACRLKAWRKEQKAKKEANLTWSECPGCWCDFPHKNPKKRFCSTKCKSAYNNQILRERERRDNWKPITPYTAPLTDEEQVALMLARAFRSQDAEDKFGG